MADSASKQDVLPKPNFKNGRFEIPWDNPGYPSSWNVLKFMTVHKNESNVPSQKVCPKFITFGTWKIFPRIMQCHHFQEMLLTSFVRDLFSVFLIIYTNFCEVLI